MSLFKNYTPKQLEIEIKGEPLVLSEPSAYALTEYYGLTEPLMKRLEDAREANDDFKINLLNTELNLRLASICLTRTNEGLTAGDIYVELRNAVTTQDEILTLVQAAGELCGLKQTESDSQDGNLQED